MTIMNPIPVTPKELCQGCNKNRTRHLLYISLCPQDYTIGKGKMQQLIRELVNLNKPPVAPPKEEEEIDSPIIHTEEDEPLPPAPTSTTKPVDQFIHEFVNNERLKIGNKPLAYDEALEAIALRHSKDMIAQNYFSHTDKNGNNHATRMRNGGYTGCRNTGENIAWFSSSRLSRMTNQEIANKIMYGEKGWWLSTKGHKEALLSPFYTVQGIGIYISGSKVMATQNFCRK